MNMIFIETNIPERKRTYQDSSIKSLISLDQITHIDKDTDTTIIFLADGTFVKDNRSIEQWHQLLNGSVDNRVVCSIIQK